MVTHSGRSDLPCSNAIEGHAAHGFDPADGVKSHRILRSCTTCGSAAETRCPTCGTWYCSQPCLKKDWVHHQPICRPLKDEFNGDSAPVNHVRAILFPRDAVKPAWVWVNLRCLDVSISRHLGITIKTGFLKKPKNQLAVKDINKSLTHRTIGHGIRQFTAPKVRFDGPDGCNINKSIFALADPGSLRTYFGSAIFFGFRTYLTAGKAKIYYEDASPPRLTYDHRVHLSKLSGTVVEGGELVDVLSKDVLRSRTKCDFAAMAGLPWVIQHCYDTFDPITDRGKELDFLYNRIGSIFAPQTKGRFQQWRLDNIEGWVLPPHLPSKYCGSLLVMHQDGGTMTTPHVGCFYNFVVERLLDVNPHIIYQTEEEGVGRALTDADELERVINKENFEPFFIDKMTTLINIFGFQSPYNEINVVKADPVPLAMAEEEAKEGVNGKSGKNGS
ncbi:hypothetical protein CIB48_g5768 [Xylaria polymorpha]|nr:hypothetical protein CIB48_g5768 [Xylaria polymorpha]